MQVTHVNVKPRVLKSLIKAMNWYENPPNLFKEALNHSESYHETINEIITDKLVSLYPALKQIQEADDEYMECYEVRGDSIVLTISDTNDGSTRREVMLTP